MVHLLDLLRAFRFFTRSGTSVNPGPMVVTSITPNNGPQAGGTAVVVRGALFQPGCTISFDSALTWVPAVFVNDTQISGVSPAGPAGGSTITVNNPDGSFATSAAGLWTYT